MAESKLIETDANEQIMTFDEWYEKIGWKVACHPNADRAQYHTARAAYEYGMTVGEKISNKQIKH